MSRALLVLTNQGVRDKAIGWIKKAPDGVRVTFQDAKRTLPQNDRQWALLTAVADQLDWNGRKYSTADWKDYFMLSLKGEEWMPDEDGGWVPIGLSTSRLSKDEHSKLTALIEAFCARQGVDLEDR